MRAPTLAAASHTYTAINRPIPPTRGRRTRPDTTYDFPDRTLRRTVVIVAGDRGELAVEVLGQLGVRHRRPVGSFSEKGGAVEQHVELVQGRLVVARVRRL